MVRQVERWGWTRLTLIKTPSSLVQVYIAILCEFAIQATRVLVGKESIVTGVVESVFSVAIGGTDGENV